MQPVGRPISMCCADVANKSQRQGLSAVFRWKQAAPGFESGSIGSGEARRAPLCQPATRGVIARPSTPELLSTLKLRVMMFSGAGLGSPRQQAYLRCVGFATTRPFLTAHGPCSRRAARAAPGRALFFFMDAKSLTDPSCQRCVTRVAPVPSGWQQCVDRVCG